MSFSNPGIQKNHARIAIIDWRNNYKIQALKSEKFSHLPSYVEHIVLKPPGTLLNEPESLFDVVAYVLLTNENLNELLRDYSTLTDLEIRHELF